MAWISPVTSRTSTSKYNFSDVNRVDNNTQYLRDYIEDELLLPLVLPETYTTKDNTGLGYASMINELENNINAIRDYLGYDPTGWATLNATWLGNSYAFIYTNANDLEENQELLKTELENIQGSQIKVNEPLAICGNIPPRF